MTGCEGQGESLVVLGYVVEVLNLETGTKEEDTRLSDTNLQFPVTDRGMNSSSWLDMQSREIQTGRELEYIPSLFILVCTLEAVDSLHIGSQQIPPSESDSLLFTGACQRSACTGGTYLCTQKLCGVHWLMVTFHCPAQYKECPILCVLLA